MFCCRRIDTNGRPHYKEIQFGAPIVLSMSLADTRESLRVSKGKIFCWIADSCLPRQHEALYLPEFRR